MNIRTQLILIFLSLSPFFFGQTERIKFVDFDQLSSKFNTKTYHVNAQELYKVNATIELHNIFFSKDHFLLISLFPDFQKNFAVWQKIDGSVNAQDILSTDDFVKRWSKTEYSDSKAFRRFYLFKKIKNETYIVEMNLIEAFNVGPYPAPLIGSSNTLNLSESKVSIEEMEKVYHETFTKKNVLYAFPMDPRVMDHFTFSDLHYEFRNYLSRNLKIKGLDAFQFWNFSMWGVIDGYNWKRGIDRFIYIPDYGIVGGSYDFYFAHNMKSTLTDVQLYENMIHEKVILADEFKK